MIFMAATMCALCSFVASAALPQGPLASSDSSASVEVAHLKNSQLAHEVLFGQLGLDTVDVGVLVEAERAELMAALRDSGLQLGDRVKIRLWMDQKMPSKEASPSAEPATERRAQVETAVSASPSISDDAPEHGCGGAPDLPSPAASACRAGRRVQEKEEASTAKGGGLSAETVAIMVTVLLGLASYGAACPHVHTFLYIKAATRDRPAPGLAERSNRPQPCKPSWRATPPTRRWRTTASSWRGSGSGTRRGCCWRACGRR